MSRRSNAPASRGRTQDQAAAAIEAEEASNLPSPSDGEKLAKAYAPVNLAQDDRHLLIMQLVGGIRIHVKDGESAGSVALRVVDIAEKVWQYGVERGFLQDENAG